MKSTINAYKPCKGKLSVANLPAGLGTTLAAAWFRLIGLLVTLRFTRSSRKRKWLLIPIKPASRANRTED